MKKFIHFIGDTKRIFFFLEVPYALFVIIILAIYIVTIELSIMPKRKENDNEIVFDDKEKNKNLIWSLILGFLGLLYFFCFFLLPESIFITALLIIPALYLLFKYLKESVNKTIYIKDKNKFIKYTVLNKTKEYKVKDIDKAYIKEHETILYTKSKIFKINDTMTNYCELIYILRENNIAIEMDDKESRKFLSNDTDETLDDYDTEMDEAAFVSSDDIIKLFDKKLKDDSSFYSIFILIKGMAFNISFTRRDKLIEFLIQNDINPSSPYYDYTYYENEFKDKIKALIGNDKALIIDLAEKDEHGKNIKQNVKDEDLLKNKVVDKNTREYINNLPIILFKDTNSPTFAIMFLGILLVGLGISQLLGNMGLDSFALLPFVLAFIFVFIIWHFKYTNKMRIVGNTLELSNHSFKKNYTIEDISKCTIDTDSGLVDIEFTDGRDFSIFYDYTIYTIAYFGYLEKELIDKNIPFKYISEKS